MNNMLPVILWSVFIGMAIGASSGMVPWTAPVAWSLAGLFAGAALTSVLAHLEICELKV